MAFNFKPDQPNKPLKTTGDLNSWMSKNGCNFLSYQVDSLPISEGFIIAEQSGQFTWSYTERGTKRVIKSFENEGDAVRYAFERIVVDGWAWSRMVGFVKTKPELESLKAALIKRKIAFYDDSIPYGGHDDPRYRVFVHGCHAVEVSDLQQIYCNRG